MGQYLEDHFIIHQTVLLLVIINIIHLVVEHYLARLVEVVAKKYIQGGHQMARHQLIIIAVGMKQQQKPIAQMVEEVTELIAG